MESKILAITANQVRRTDSLVGNDQFIRDSRITLPRNPRFPQFGHVRFSRDGCVPMWRIITFRHHAGRVEPMEICKGISPVNLLITSQLPSCILLMSAADFPHFQSGCKMAEIELERYHFDGTLSEGVPEGVRM